MSDASHVSAASREDPLTIRAIYAYPLRATLPRAQSTSQGDYPAVEIVVVEVKTASGHVGWGECLARRGAAAYADLVTAVLAPRLIGRSAHDRRALWKVMRASLSGRGGGMLLEAIAGVDVALWDLAGKAAGQPVHRLLGGIGRSQVEAYASSINWRDDAAAEAEVAAARAKGFSWIKVKLGRPIPDAIRRARLVRDLVGSEVTLVADANWAYDVDEAVAVGRVLADLDYGWFEEPIAPEDRAGYALLRQKLGVRLAAGESDYVATHTRELLADRSLGVIQPDVARSGGITETWRIAELAAVHHTAYAPHVGWSGAVCAAASLQLAAAAESFLTFECMVFDNPLRQELLLEPVGEAAALRDGRLPVPQGPGLGIEIDRAVLERFRVGG